MEKPFGIPLIVCIALSILQTQGATENETSIPAVIRFRSGTLTRVTMADQELRLRTYAGDLRFEIPDIRSITFDQAPPLSRVRIVDGSLWRAEVLTDSLVVHDGDRTREIALDPESVESIETVGKRGKVVKRPSVTATVLFQDGTGFLADLGDTHIKIATGTDTWSLPLASLSSLDVITGDTQTPLRLLLEFPSGFTTEVTPAGWSPSFRARTSTGAEVTVLFEDIRRLATTPAPALIGAPISSPRDARRADAGNRSPLSATVSPLDEAEPFSVELAFSVLNIRSALGTVRLPLPLIRAVEHIPDHSETRVTTLYGETLIGRIRPDRLRVAPDRDIDTPVELPETETLRLHVDALEPPEAWPVWRLDDGSLVHGRLTTEQLDVALPDADGQDRSNVLVSAENIVSLFRHPGRGFTLTLGDRQIRGCEPASSKAELVLLCSRSVRAVPWSRVLAMGGSLEQLRSLPLYGQAAEVRPETLHLETAMGRLHIDKALVRTMHHDTTAGLTCVETVFGECYVASLLSAEEASGDAGQDRAEFPPVVTFGNDVRPVPPGWLACRLDTGDIFYGRLLNTTLGLHPLSDATDRIEIMALALQELRPDNEGTFVCTTSGGKLQGALDTDRLDVELLGTLNHARLPVDAVDIMRSGTVDGLPPPAAVRPGLIPMQRGEVLVRGGTFTMGRTKGQGMPDEMPAHEVTLSSFFMDACEITRDQFLAFVSETGYETSAEESGSSVTWRYPGFRQTRDEPAVCLTWFDAVAFCNWRSERYGLQPCYEPGASEGTMVCHRRRNGYHLPTEAEWEYAARQGGQPIRFPWGDADSRETAVSYANFAQDAAGVSDRWVWTHPAKTFPANSLGLYALGGNAWEWCDDWYFSQAYQTFVPRETVDPCVGADYVAGLTHKVMRGGSFHNKLDLLRCASRGHGSPRAFAPRVGFRCVRNASAKQE